MTAKAERYEMAVRRNLAAELSGDLELCPKCGMRYVLPDTRSGRMGVCATCWNRALAAAIAAADAEEASRAEYDKMRQWRRRGRMAASGEF